MIFDIYADFETYKSIEVGKRVKLTFDGFEAYVRFLKYSDGVLTFETTEHIVNKLKQWIGMEE